MKKLITICTIALFVVTAAPTAAQTFGFGAHAGVSIPTGDYGDSDPVGTADAGLAELGFSGGLDLWYPLMPALSWYTSVDAIAHSIDEDAAEGDATGGYLYFPVMTGLRYDIPLGAVGLFATGQLGVVFARPPTRVIGTTEVDGDFGTEFGFNFGAGAQITENIYAGMKYYPLGDVEWGWEGEEPVELPVSFFDIYVGFGVR